MRVAISFPPFESDKGIPLLSQNRQYQVFSTRQSKGGGVTGLFNKFVGNNATVIFPAANEPRGSSLLLPKAMCSYRISCFGTMFSVIGTWPSQPKMSASSPALYVSMGSSRVERDRCPTAYSMIGSRQVGCVSLN